MMMHYNNSRMTIAHLIETLLGKQGLQTGHEGDATPFIECTVAEISNNLHEVSSGHTV
jgi:DNA-directed RNA polymerase beta subunit